MKTSSNARACGCPRARVNSRGPKSCQSLHVAICHTCMLAGPEPWRAGRGQAGPGQSREEGPSPGACPARITLRGPRPHSHSTQGHWHQDPALGAACPRVG